MQLIRHTATYTAIVAAFCIVFAVMIANVTNTSLFAHTAQTEPADADDLRQVMLRLGYGPEALTAAGLTTTEAELLVNAVADVIAAETNWADLVYHDAQVAENRAQVAELTGAVRAGIATEQEHDQLDQAAADLATHQAGADAILDDCREATDEVLSTAQQAALQTMHANRNREVPIEFTIAERAENDWIKLRSAVAHVRQCETHNIESDPDLHAFLDACQSEPDVAAAKATLDANLDAITFSWKQAIDNLDE